PSSEAIVADEGSRPPRHALESIRRPLRQRLRPLRLRKPEQRAGGSQNDEADSGHVHTSARLRKREDVIPLRLHLPFLAVERILPDGIAAGSPRRARGERDVLVSADFVNGGNPLRTRPQPPPPPDP